MKRKKTPADYRALAQKRGFRWLGPEVPNVHTKSQWECQQGHRWWVRFFDVRKGRGCPICAGRHQKTPADYQTMAEKRGFRWLGPEVANTNLKTTWECSQGHHWQTTYKKIHQGTGCPTCAKGPRKTRLDYQVLAQERGFRWLGQEVPNTLTKTEWECEQGHRWWTSYTNLRAGAGCPTCARNRRKKTAADYRAMAQKRGFRWLEVEVANVKTKTQWECQQGHCWWATYIKIHQGSGCPTCAKGPRKTHLDYQALAQKCGCRWLGLEVPDVLTKTVWECEQGHRWRTSYTNLRRGKGCPICNKNRRRKTPADYRAMAQKRGFRWLEVEVANTGVKTQWECQQGHRWWATYKKIHQGSGCPICAGRRPKIPPAS